MHILTLLLILTKFLMLHARHKSNFYDSDNKAKQNISSPLIRVNDELRPVRKCCFGDQFYSTVTQECEKTEDTQSFHSTVKTLLIRSDDIELSPTYERIKACPQTFKAPKNVIVSSNSSHHLFEDGSVFDSEEIQLYNLTHYCLELVGNDVDSSVLVFAFCPPKEFFVPKCCPLDHYFDTRINDCSAYYFVNGTEGDATLLPHITEGYSLNYRELLCLDSPELVDLKESEFMQDTLCLENLENCYPTEKYCIDNYLDVGNNLLYPVAFVCPDYFINKCCPDDQSLFVGGCTLSPRRSISMLHMLKHHRYQIKGSLRENERCDPLTIEDETRSDIAWEINSFGLAVITKSNKTVYTRSYCIDDFRTETEVFPVIKVCSEEIDEYPVTSSIEDYENALGKCCPSGMVYHPNAAAAVVDEVTPLCIREDALEGHSLHEISTDMTKYIYYGFPSCGNGKEIYHHYQFLNRSKDFAELAEDNSLRVIYKENECTTKETLVDQSNFCMDFMILEDNLMPVAIICAPSYQTPHPERNSITVAFIGVSCAALIFTLFSLIFMRVRRGMVTMKKMNTLAGRILISYVTSQLLSFVSLAVGVLVDFGEDIHHCFVLGGFILFFSIGSFCWNTSICLEGLLLTLHVKTTEKRRFLCHCLWAWGVPTVITTVAIVRDFHREELPCDAITPKFGLEHCFFSDLVAKILYFLLPISMTVILNGFFLVTARVVRRKQLKELEKDPHRIRRHGTLKQVFSIKNRKSIKKQAREEKSTHSGLRTHQFQNTWLESTKLALWSGGTWIMELVAVTITLKYGRSQGEWYQYLWYIPVGFNCLRGVGIFIIIVLTPDNKTRFVRTVRTFYSNVGQSVSNSAMSLHPHHARALSRKQAVRFKNSIAQQNRKEEQRKVSISTVLTYLSGTQLSFEQDSIKRPAEFCHSVSQIDFRRNSSASVLSDVFEVSEHDDDNHFYEDYNNSIDGDYWGICIENMDYCTRL